MHHPILGAVAVLASAALLSGCGCDDVACEPCGPGGILVSVFDEASEAAIEGASVTTGESTCEVAPATTEGTYQCDVPPGSYTIVVEAPGYAPPTIEATLQEEEDPGCCSCGPLTLVDAPLARP